MVNNNIINKLKRYVLIVDDEFINQEILIQLLLLSSLLMVFGLLIELLNTKKKNRFSEK